MSKQVLAVAQREVEWRDRLARQAVSGQSIAAFCRSEGITEGAFYTWRGRLGAGNPDGARVKGPIRPPSAFIDIGAINDVAAHKSLAVDDVRGDSADKIEVRIDLGQGVVLQIMKR